MIASTALTLSRQTKLSIIGIIGALVVGLLVWAASLIGHLLPPSPPLPPIATATPSPTPSLTATPTPSITATPGPISAHFSDQFLSRSTLQEAGNMAESSSKSWWLNSGGLFYSRGGYAQTIQGMLPLGSKWQVEYATSNPTDTDSGLHPQNIFRLVTRTTFRQLTQQAYFRIDANQLSSSSNRNASNGLLLFNRYQDGDNLYYTGLRVDGYAVIKKKYKGTYYTMAEQRVVPGAYNHDTSPDLLPEHRWIGLRSIVTTNPDGTVAVQLWSDIDQPGIWQKVTEAVDDGKNYGGPPITARGFGGIRTDFVDASFHDYSIAEQPN